jgi:hypothetical protein
MDRPMYLGFAQNRPSPRCCAELCCDFTYVPEAPPSMFHITRDTTHVATPWP